MKEEENPTLTTPVKKDSKLKKLVVDYIGETINPDDGDVTVDMAIEVFAKEFPEFLLAIAEENFVRGYEQAFIDIETHSEPEKESLNNEDE
tara:strand:- start:221 stop:493 length:273 start_codon:yes stop_codon:yes gene_type:complete